MKNNFFYIANIRIPTEKAHGIQVMKMCEAFSKLDLNVELVVPNRTTTISEDPFVYHKVRKDFTIKKIWCIDSVKWGRAGFLLESFTFGLSVLSKYMSKDGIFYTREESLAFLFKFLGKNVVWEGHRGGTNFFIRYLIKCNAKIVVISNGLKNLYIKEGGKSENILVAPDAVDLEEFSKEISREGARQALNLSPDKKIVMYIGLLDKWKGVDTLLEASKISSTFQVVIIGGTIEQISKLQKDYADVIFLGYKPYSELPSNQKAADILVIPNSGKEKISSLYTSPIKLFAHMTSGIPLLVSDLPSMREVVNENMVTFFEADNPTSLIEGLNRIEFNYRESLNNARAAQEEVKKYTWLKRAHNIKLFLL